jgi:hypothetical protein
MRDWRYDVRLRVFHGLAVLLTCIDSFVAKSFALVSKFSQEKSVLALVRKVSQEKAILLL